MKKMAKWVGLVLFIEFCHIQPANAYIDPGTGSMLFSVVLGCLATLFFVFNSIWLKFKQNFFAKKDLAKNNIPFVIYSEGNKYFSVFKPVLDEFEKREITLHYYTSDEKDLILNSNYKFIKPEFIGSSAKAYLKLAFLKADICLMTTPQLDVLQLKRSKFTKHYAHIFHGITTSMDYRPFSLDYYDSVLCDGEFQIPLIRELEEKRGLHKKECPVVGSTYMDYLENIKNGFNPSSNNDFTILIAPSWGPCGLLSKFGSDLIDEVLKTNFRVIIRPHPQSRTVEKDLINDLMKKYEENKNLIWDLEDDNLKTLNESNILISDFSCILFDYAFLFNKPFIYSSSDMETEIYDMADLDEEPFRFRIMKKIGKELTRENLQNIGEIIQNFKENKEIEEEIQKAKEISWMKRGEAAKNVTDFMIQKQKELEEC